MLTKTSTSSHPKVTPHGYLNILKLWLLYVISRSIWEYLY